MRGWWERASRRGDIGGICGTEPGGGEARLIENWDKSKGEDVLLSRLSLSRTLIIAPDVDSQLLFETALLSLRADAQHELEWPAAWTRPRTTQFPASCIIHTPPSTTHTRTRFLTPLPLIRLSPKTCPGDQATTPPTILSLHNIPTPKSTKWITFPTMPIPLHSNPSCLATPPMPTQITSHHPQSTPVLPHYPSTRPRSTAALVPTEASPAAVACVYRRGSPRAMSSRSMQLSLSLMPFVPFFTLSISFAR